MKALSDDYLAELETVVVEGSVPELLDEVRRLLAIEKVYESLIPLLAKGLDLDQAFATIRRVAAKEQRLRALHVIARLADLAETLAPEPGLTLGLVLSGYEDVLQQAAWVAHEASGIEQGWFPAGWESSRPGCADGASQPT